MKNRSRAMCRLALLLCAAALPASAEPFARTSAGEVTITLHKAPCRLKGEITNLPSRVVWLEKGKETEGCWGISAQFGVVMLYFADKTAAAVPVQAFERLTST